MIIIRKGRVREQGSIGITNRQLSSTEEYSGGGISLKFIKNR